MPLVSIMREGCRAQGAGWAAEQGLGGARELPFSLGEEGEQLFSPLRPLSEVARLGPSAGETLE